MRLYLIRHGLTEANLRRLYYGATDLPLCEEGIQGILAAKARGLYPDRAGLKLYTSGLLRTEQTLSLIYGDVPHEALPAWAEMDFGAFEMKSYEELKNNPDYIRWIEDESGELACPGGETNNQALARFTAGLKLLRERNQDALVITHGGVIARLMGWLFPEEPFHFYQRQPKAGEGYLQLWEAGGRAAWHRVALPETTI